MNNSIDADFWSNKKILITGHTGFKGSWLSAILYNFGSKVYGISDFEKNGIYKEIKDKNLFKKEFFLDINNINNKIIDEFNKIKFDYIFHFAAQSLVSEAYKEPIRTINSNSLGTLKILDLFNKLENPKILTIASTDKVYKIPNFFNIETSELGWSEYYSLSKVYAESLIKLYLQNDLLENKNVNVIRSGNVIGGGDIAINRLIPDTINAIKKDDILIMRNKNSLRPWQHILDSLAGYLLATQFSEQNKKNTIYNLSSEINNKITSFEIVEKLYQKWGVKPKIGIEKSFKEVETLLIDSSKALDELKWQPKVDINECITLIYNWEEAKDKFKETIHQINNYFSNTQKGD